MFDSSPELKPLTDRFLMNSHPSNPVKMVKRIVLGVIVGTAIIVGSAMTILHHPTSVVIPAGLAVLATEGILARNWIRRIRDNSRRLSLKHVS